MYALWNDRRVVTEIEVVGGGQGDEKKIERKKEREAENWRELNCARLIFVNRPFDVPSSQPHFNILGFVKAIADSRCNDPGV